MADITAQVVNAFRKSTGLGLMECKALLKEADGDPKKAMVLAQEKGKANAAKRAGRAASSRPGRGLHPPRRQVRRPGRGQLRDRLRRPERRVPPVLPRTWPSTSSPPTPSAVTPRGEWTPTIVEEQRRIFLKQVEDKPEPIRGQDRRRQDQLLVRRERPARSGLRQGLRPRPSETSSWTDVNARVGENVTVARFARFIVGENAKRRSSPTPRADRRAPR